MHQQYDMQTSMQFKDKRDKQVGYYCEQADVLILQRIVLAEIRRTSCKFGRTLGPPRSVYTSTHSTSVIAYCFHGLVVFSDIIRF